MTKSATATASATLCTAPANRIRDVSLFSWGGGALFFGGEGHNFFPLLSGGGSQFFSRFFRGGS